MKNHKHTRLGRAICRYIPCRWEIEEAQRVALYALRSAVEAERRLLYDMLDNGHAEDAEDELLALFARNGSTDKGTIRRTRREIAAAVIDDNLAARLDTAGIRFGDPLPPRGGTARPVSAREMPRVGPTSPGSGSEPR